MKQIIILFSVILSGIFVANDAVAQAKVSQKTLKVIERFQKVDIPEIITQDWVEAHFKDQPVYKVFGEYCLSMMALKSAGFSTQGLDKDCYVGSISGDVVTLKVPLKKVKDVLSFKFIDYLEVADRIAGMSNHKMVVDTRADSVWAGLGLSQSYTGKNVLIGITDWGFDYGHPMFMDTTLTYSRIRAAWDHFKQEGDQPSGFGYGVEYDTPQELAAAESDTASTYYDYATHGSHVAGICAGSGAGTIYRGVAFEAEYLFNSIQLDVGAAIDAFNWMKNIADADGKRLVINMSWGLYYLGTMDGTSLVSQAIDNLSAQGVVFVTSAGNNGDVNFHLKKDFSMDTLRSRLQFYPYASHPNMWGQSISSWGEVGEDYSMQIEIYDGSNLLVDATPVYSTNVSGYYDSILKIGMDTVFYNFTIENTHPLNNRPMIWTRVKNINTGLKVVMRTFATSGTVHYWNVVELDNGVGNWGQSFYSYGNGGMAGDAHYGVGEPACSESAISVAAHSSAAFTQSGVEYPGNLASFSSEGPTYDERNKPDVSAPGVGVISSINSYTTAGYTIAATTTFNGKTYHFSAFSGTSMSSPATAGVAALVLEANPDLSTAEVKEILKTTARQDSKTGNISWPGNSEWGMGKVTATTAVALAETLASIDQVQESSWRVYPNPSSDWIHLSKLDGTSGQMVRFRLLSLNGSLLDQGIVTEGKYAINHLSSGVYFLELEEKGEREIIKIVKF